jgi:hypothetical protein
MSQSISNEDFYAAFSQYTTASGKKSNQKFTKNFEQSGGAQIVMSPATVLRNALGNVTVQTFYGHGGVAKNALYMRGEIEGNKLNIKLISALTHGGAPQDVCTNVPVVPGEFSWTKKTLINNADQHLIEIKEGKYIYSQHHLARAGAGGDQYKFCHNGNPGVPLTNAAPLAAGNFYDLPGIVPAIRAVPAIGANAPGPIFNKRNFLIVDLTDTKVYNGAEQSVGPTNMTEEIINYLLHQLVQYKLADNILCVYEANKVTKLTVAGNTTLTSYATYNKIRLANDLQDNVFSQCFEHFDRSDNKLKVVHAVTHLVPSDSSINMKYCSTKNFNGFANLTKALAISDPFNRRLNEESIFYLCLRAHTFDVAGVANANLVAAQQVEANDHFISGTFGQNDANGTAVNEPKVNQINNPLNLAIRFDHITNGAAVIDRGIGRFVVHPVTGNLLIYEEENNKNTRLVCYNYDGANNHNMIQPYSKFLGHVPGAVLMNPPKIERAGNVYRLVIQTKANAAAAGDRTFPNEYNATAHQPIAAGNIAMHVSTASTSETQSNFTIADALFE